MRVGASLRTSLIVDDVRQPAGWLVERARAAWEAELDSLIVGDKHVKTASAAVAAGVPGCCRDRQASLITGDSELRQSESAEHLPATRHGESHRIRGDETVNPDGSPGRATSAPHRGEARSTGHGAAHLPPPTSRAASEPLPATAIIRRRSATLTDPHVDLCDETRTLIVRAHLSWHRR
jgi:hypothetical protein